LHGGVPEKGIEEKKQSARRSDGRFKRSFALNRGFPSADRASAAMNSGLLRGSARRGLNPDATGHAARPVEILSDAG
jgi:HSP20 family molecular chaperone IbpA